MTELTLPPSDTRALLAGAAPPPLARGAVHVWAWSLTADGASIETARALLDDHERLRAARFVRQAHRDRFALAHGVLRAVLAGYAKVAPGALAFVRGDGGKPALDGADIAFNLSHSADRAVLAVGHEALGVDVEHPRERLDPIGLASRYFFGSEYDAIERAPAAQQRQTFLRYWVAKEAVLKAQGVGLAFPLDAFGIVFAADGRSARVASSQPERLSPAWTVRMLSLARDWPVAVAASGDAWSLVRCAHGAPRA